MRPLEGIRILDLTRKSATSGSVVSSHRVFERTANVHSAKHRISLRGHSSNTRMRWRIVSRMRGRCLGVRADRELLKRQRRRPIQTPLSPGPIRRTRSASLL
jgi:hypothetical protein